jgi:hypothetical protein
MYQNTWTKDLEGGIMTLDMTLDLVRRQTNMSSMKKVRRNISVVAVL